MDVVKHKIWLPLARVFSRIQRPWFIIHNHYNFASLRLLQLTPTTSIKRPRIIEKGNVDFTDKILFRDIFLSMASPIGKTSFHIWNKQILLMLHEKRTTTNCIIVYCATKSRVIVILFVFTYEATNALTERQTLP